MDRLRLRLVLGVAEVLTGVSRCSRARRRQLGLLALLNSGASRRGAKGRSWATRGALGALQALGTYGHVPGLPWTWGSVQGARGLRAAPFGGHPPLH